MKLSPKILIEKLMTFVGYLNRYSVLLFFILLVAVYGFLWFRINSLTNAQPSSNDISSATTTTVSPHIDPSVVAQLQSLQDNSVSVQALFSQARNNPFQE
ncbi:MAG TPA: hypothetical protein VNE40_02860 [Candidatus Dormibacteraeota bacterium]|nr:hypothetical protein [Candidatus Dormibacteraeota bacterium]